MGLPNDGELRFTLMDSLIKSENDSTFKEMQEISLLPGDFGVSPNF